MGFVRSPLRLGDSLVSKAVDDEVECTIVGTER